LPLARADHAPAYLRRAFAFGRGGARQLFKFHRGHVNVYVYAVKQRPRNAPDVALNLQRRAAALARRVVPEPAGAGVHRGGEHERGGEGQGHRRAADRDLLVFERLAEDFEDAAVEFGQLDNYISNSSD